MAKSNWHYVVEALVTFDSTSNLVAELTFFSSDCTNYVFFTSCIVFATEGDSGSAAEM